jgi:adenylate kinase family enzyme
MRIHILGLSGSGKTTFAKELSQITSISSYDLDEVFWKKQGTSYEKREEETRRKVLDDIILQDNWILEGVYYSWLEESFQKSDWIIYLDVKEKVCKRRIWRRYFLHKLGLQKGKKDTFTSTKHLVEWMENYHLNNDEHLTQMLSPYKKKYIIIHNAKEKKDFMERIKNEWKLKD